MCSWLNATCSICYMLLPQWMNRYTRAASVDESAPGSTANYHLKPKAIQWNGWTEARRISRNYSAPPSSKRTNAVTAWWLKGNGNGEDGDNVCVYESACFASETTDSGAIRLTLKYSAEIRVVPTSNIKWVIQKTLFPIHFLLERLLLQACGPGSSVGIAIDYGLEGPRSNPGGDEIFRNCPDRPWGTPSLLYNAFRVFLRGRGGLGVRLTPPSNVEGPRKE